MVSEPLESSEGLAMADEGLNEAEAAVLKTSFDQFALGQEEIRKSMNEVKVMLLQLLKAKISTPLWIAELSDMADEVRDRTILVKINSQMHPIDDLVIYHVFSEIGTVEDVRYLPTESGFHSRVRFRIKQSSDWAFHYYNGRRLHQGCCELEVHRANDVINWNLQRIANLEAACVNVDAPAITNDDCLLAAKLKNDKMLKYIEESTEIDIKDEQIDTKKPSDFVAYKVLDEMSADHEYKSLDEIPKSDEDLRQTEESIQEGELKDLKALNQGAEVVRIETNDETIVAKRSIDLTAYQVFDEMPMAFDKGIGLVDAFPKEFEVSLDVTIDQEAPPLTSDEEKDDSNSKVFGECKTETELLGELEMENVLVTALCFDPGGRALKQVDNSLHFEDGAREDDKLRCCHKELYDVRCLFGASYFDITTQEHVVCDASKVNFQPKKLMLETFSIGSDMQLMVAHFLFELLVKTSYGKVEDITKHELDDDVQLLVFDPGGNGLDLALSTLDVGVLRYHANVFVFDPGGNLSMLLVLEPIACLEKIGSRILNFSILDDNLKGLL